MHAVVPPDGIAVGLLGPVTLTVDGTGMALGGLRRRAVLAVLAASASAPVPAERLAEAVWSDVGRPSSRSTLQVHVHQVRQLMGRHAGRLRHTPSGYRLDGAILDVRTAEERLRRARAAQRSGDDTAAAEHNRSALALWRGEFCADLADLEYFRAARALYDTMRLDALEAAFAAELRLGRPGLVAEIDALLVAHPLRERLWGQLMVALYRDGRQADALGAYRRARAVLAEEAGIDPGTVLRHLEGAILDRAGATALLEVLGPGQVAARRPLLTWLDGVGVARTRELPPSGRVVIGRDGAADIALPWDGEVSRLHAAVVVEGGRAVVADLGSRNGTFHNGIMLAAPSPLRPGDLLRCGATVLTVNAPPATRQPAPAPDDDTRTAG